MLAPKRLFWGVMGTFFLACALVGVNVADSLLFKPMVVLIMCPALVVLLFLHAASGREGRFSFTPAHLILLAMLAVSAASMADAINVSASLRAIGMQACFLFFFAAAFETLELEDGRERAKAVLLSIAALECAAGFVLYYYPHVTGVGVMAVLAQCVSTFGSTMFFGGYLAAMIPFALGIYAEDSTWSRKKILALVLIAAMIFLLILTGSKGAWIGALCASIGFGFARSDSQRGRLATILVVAAVVCAAFWVFPQWMAHRIQPTLALNSQSTFARRLYFYQGAWDAFRSSPLLGHGIGNFSTVLPKFRSPEYWMMKSEDIVAHAHNEYLEILAETGIAGLFAFAAFIGWYIVTVVRAAKRSGSRTTSSFLYGCVFGVAAILIADLAEFNLRTTTGSLMFLLLIALSLRAAGGTFFTFRAMFSMHPAVRYLLLTALALYFVALVPACVREYNASRASYYGYQAEARGNSIDECEDFRQAVRLSPEDDDTRYKLAETLLEREEYSEAAQECSTILVSRPYYPKAKLVRAIAEFELGQADSSTSDIQSELAIEDEPLTVYYASYFRYRKDNPARELSYLNLLLRNGMQSGDTSYVTRAVSRFASLELSQPAYLSHHLLDSLSSTFYSDPPISSAIDSCNAVLAKARLQP
jgi:O-antigen ligase